MLQKLQKSSTKKEDIGRNMEAIVNLFQEYVYKLSQHERINFSAKEAEDLLNDVLIALLSKLDTKDSKLMVKLFQIFLRQSF